MTINDKIDKLEAYCNSIDCDECKLLNGDWTEPFNESINGKIRNCLKIYSSPESDLDKALSMIHADKITEMREKIKAYCNSTQRCMDCPLYSFKGQCYDNDETVEEHYNMIFNNNNESNDPVNRPSHYTDGKIEVIDFIQDKKLGFCLGNAVKYIARAGKKDPDKTIEDLKKARWYIDRQIKTLEEVSK